MRREGMEFWKRHAEGWRVSGRTLEAYCRVEGLVVATFLRWRKRIDRADREQAGTAAALIPVTVKATTQAPARRATGEMGLLCAGFIEIRLGNGRTIALGQAFEDDALARVIRLLESLPC